MQKVSHDWRELTLEEMGRLLKKHRSGRLGLCDGGRPYVVPVAYGYSDGKIYFHGAKTGKKLDIIRRNDSVCFEIDQWQKGWASVICYGRVVLRDDFEAKERLFRLLMGVEMPAERIEKLNTTIGIVTVEEMTGRCSTDFEFD